MDTPRTVDEFVAQATRETKTAQDALKRYLDEWANANRTSVGIWQGMQQAGLQAAFDSQDAAVQASRGVLDAAAQAGRNWGDQWAQGLQQAQGVTAGLWSASAQLMEVALPSRRE